MPRVLEIAIQTASRGAAGRNRPARRRRLRDAVEHTPTPRVSRADDRACGPSDEEISALAKVLNASEKITILGGPGVPAPARRARPARRRAESSHRACAPRKEIHRVQQSFDVGMTGLLGFSSGYTP